MTKKKPKPKPPASRNQPPAHQNHQAIATLESFSGPLPHPGLLKLYNEVIPGAANRILSMAEQEAAHQQGIENAALQCAATEARRGQWFGLIIGVCAFASAIAAVVLGSEGTAMVIGGSTVVGLVTVFVVGRKAPPQKPKGKN